MPIANSMIRTGRVLVLILLGLVGLIQPTQAYVLEALRDSGDIIASHTLDEGERWCVHWNHSVQGFLVRDCYRVVEGRMMLERSHQPDFAAGLGHIPGRGDMISAPEGGYWIEDIDEMVDNNCYRLRVGAKGVDHTLVFDDGRTNLSALAERERISIVLRGEEDPGGTTC